ncbi:sigma intracellular receptor 2 isoform X2 [Echeneis naucrates]|uniref:sigma intracellular receptor 2 isoform X2 n=1 Tax=Echeneis naucrates TaxID=173247 RepID=UPI001113D3B2|nr:sigma intracellular receptor 2 isoform X2 [Echeneis naucrates]
MMPQNSTCPGEVIVFILTGLLSFSLLIFLLLGIVIFSKYRSLLRTLREVRGKLVQRSVPQLETPIIPERLTVAVQQGMEAEQDEEAELPLGTLLQNSSTVRSSSRKLWRGLQQGPNFSKSDLNLLQLIKAGKEGVFYQARMNRGTCKGHNMLTCKISKEGVRPKHVDMEVSIMRKLAHHKNILQLLDWNTTEEPYVLIMEYVSYGTLRTFLQTNRGNLCTNSELQSLLTIACYHIALAMQHLRSKMIVHCDLALRNIMVNRFPWEVKVAEFGLARDFTRLTSRHSSRWKSPRQRVPLRWYPPEYFKNNHYGFKGDVWAFGIVLWEMQTFGEPHNTFSTVLLVYFILKCRPQEPYRTRTWRRRRPSSTTSVSVIRTPTPTAAGRRCEST